MDADESVLMPEPQVLPRRVGRPFVFDNFLFQVVETKRAGRTYRWNVIVRHSAFGEISLDAPPELTEAQVLELGFATAYQLLELVGGTPEAGDEA